MEYSYTISKSERRARVTVSGSYDLAGSMRATRELLDDPRFEPGFGILLDLRAMDYDAIPRFEELEIAAAARESRLHVVRGPVAVVSVPGPFFDVVRLGSSRAMLFDVTSEPFFDLAAAEKWLDSFNHD